MSSSDTIAIRLHEIGSQGQYVDMEEEYDIDDLGGIPVAGDVIVNPWVTGNRRDLNNRTVYEVVSRYFLPGAHKSVNTKYIAVVVKLRPALKSESNIVLVS